MCCTQLQYMQQLLHHVFLLAPSANGSHFVLGSCVGLAKEELNLLHFVFFKQKKNSE